MANISTVTFRIDTDLKERTEAILSEIGLTPSDALEMICEQIILYHDLPFPVRKPTAIGGMTPEEIDRELQKGWDSVEAGDVIPAQEVNEHFHELPFPVRKPTAIGDMTSEEIDREIQKGIDSANTEKMYTIEEVDGYFRQVYGA